MCNRMKPIWLSLKAKWWHNFRKCWHCSDRQTMSKAHLYQPTWSTTTIKQRKTTQVNPKTNITITAGHMEAVLTLARNAATKLMVTKMMQPFPTCLKVHPLIVIGCKNDRLGPQIVSISKQNISLLSTNSALHDLKIAGKIFNPSTGCHMVKITCQLHWMFLYWALQASQTMWRHKKKQHHVFHQAKASTTIPQSHLLQFYMHYASKQVWRLQSQNDCWQWPPLCLPGCPFPHWMLNST